MWHHRRSVRFLLGLAIALLASACSSATSPSSQPAKSATLTHLTVGVIPITDTAPFYIAIKEGYFKQEGLSVTPVIIPQSTAALPDMLHGTVQIDAGGNYVSWFTGAANGTLPIQVIAPSDQCAKKVLEVLALPKSGIKTPADLAGKTIAVNLTNNIQTLTINAVLKANNVNPATVKYVPIPFPNMAAALKAGQVDAISAVEPFVTNAEKTVGAVAVLDQCQGPTASVPLSGYWATKSWIQQHRQTALAFQRAILKAQALAQGNRQLVEQILPTYTKISPAVASLISLPYYPTTLDIAQLQRVSDLMHTYGMLKNSFNVSSAVLH